MYLYRAEMKANSPGRCYGTSLDAQPLPLFALSLGTLEWKKAFDQLSMTPPSISEILTAGSQYRCIIGNDIHDKLSLVLLLSL